MGGMGWLEFWLGGWAGLDGWTAVCVSYLPAFRPVRSPTSGCRCPARHAARS